MRSLLDPTADRSQRPHFGRRVGHGGAARRPARPRAAAGPAPTVRGAHIAPRRVDRRGVRPSRVPAIAAAAACRAGGATALCAMAPHRCCASSHDAMVPSTKDITCDNAASQPPSQTAVRPDLVLGPKARREPWRAALHLPPFWRLHGKQSIWQLAASVLPPLDHGVMWSASIPVRSKTFLPSEFPAVRQWVLLAHTPFCRS